MPVNKPAILLIDDDLQFLQEVVEGLGNVFDIRPVNAIEKAKEHLNNRMHFDLILLDLVFGNKSERLEGLEFLPYLQKKHPKIPVIIITKYGDDSNLSEAISAGAVQFFRKESSDYSNWIDTIKGEIQKAKIFSSRKDTKVPPPARKRKEASSTDKPVFIGDDPKIVAIREELEFIAQEPDLSLLILGETGVGKEVVARYLHHLRDSSGAYIAVNLSKLGDNTFESELFGSTVGAFTDAVDKQGLLEAAKGGTLMLDEIGEIPSKIQVKLLRVLEEREFRKVGSTNTVKLDVQLIFATNRNLKEEVEQGEFRLDFYHRLNDYSIHIPPLRERKADIPLIAQHYLKARGASPDFFSPDVWDYFQRYHWPGNIRELISVIKRLLLKGKIAKANEIDASFLPDEIVNPAPKPKNRKGAAVTLTNNEEEPLDRKTARIQLQEIEQSLVRHKRKSKVVEELKMENLDQLRYLINKHFRDYEDLFHDFPEICRKYKLKSK